MTTLKDVCDRYDRLLTSDKVPDKTAPAFSVEEVGILIDELVFLSVSKEHGPCCSCRYCRVP